MSTSPPAPDSNRDAEHPAPVVAGNAPGAPAASAGGRIRCLALGASVLGGLLGWLGGEAVHKEYPLVPFELGQDAKFAAEFGAQRALVASDTMRAFALQGAALGLALGLAGGLARRSTVRAGGAALAGAIVAGAGCALAARVMMPLHGRYFGTSGDEMIVPLFIHAGLWIPAGALAGLAFGLGLGGWREALRGLAGGLIGGALGAAAFEMLGAVLFPMAHTGEMISATWGSRLFARMLVAVFCGAAVALAVDSTRTKRSGKPCSEAPGGRI